MLPGLSRCAYHQQGKAAGPNAAVVSAAELALILPATLLLAVLFAAVPGRAAARIRPTVALRAE